MYNHIPYHPACITTYHIILHVCHRPGKSWNLVKIYHFVLECPGILLKVSHFHFLQESCEVIKITFQTFSFQQYNTTMTKKCLVNNDQEVSCFFSIKCSSKETTMAEQCILKKQQWLNNVF